MNKRHKAIKGKQLLVYPRAAYKVKVKKVIMRIQLRHYVSDYCASIQINL